MSTQTTDLFLLEDLKENGRTADLAERDRSALNAVADWIKAFIVRPHAELGRPGAVCPFVPTSLERQRLWLAPEHVGDGGVADVIDVINAYKRRLLNAKAEPVHGDDTNYDVIVVVFTDLPAGRAQAVFGDVMEQIAVPSYAEDGIVFGPFYDGNQGTAIYNRGFRPFQSPVPFMFVRYGVVSDWKFFLDQPEFLALWARRYGESATHALAAELRRLPWNARQD
ncbi:DUF6875 domain-containing protein [Modestobacter excelsi]|uniref:DUF6875 domain-containing protein n=1 Tax=Modestobacter excelsi TaxID=2213161 RepID=UPI00110CD031|nr:hypothetical protein [Modestobacter excelsi]